MPVIGILVMPEKPTVSACKSRSPAPFSTRISKLLPSPPPSLVCPHSCSLLLSESHLVPPPSCLLSRTCPSHPRMRSLCCLPSLSCTLLHTRVHSRTLSHVPPRTLSHASATSRALPLATSHTHLPCPHCLTWMLTYMGANLYFLTPTLVCSCICHCACSNPPSCALSCPPSSAPACSYILEKSTLCVLVLQTSPATIPAQTCTVDS